MAASSPRISLATERDNLSNTVVLRDELPPLAPGEVRMQVDKVGLSANNLFYLQMGEAPFLKFFAVYPLPEEHKHLAIMPAWGVGTVIESRHGDFAVGERFRGFLHITNVVQMKATRSADGFTASGGKRDKINPAYNDFKQVDEAGRSPIRGSGIKSDLAMTAAPGAQSGFILYELLAMNDFYGGNSVVLTSASSKLALATALSLQEAKASGAIEHIAGYTSASNREFVAATGLYDEVLAFDESPAAGDGLRHVLIDVAGDAAVYKRSKDHLVKALAVGGTHAAAEASTFTAFGASGFVKMLIDMMGPQWAKHWAARRLSPRLEMFFAPTVIGALLERWGREELDRRSDAALQHFVDAAIDNGWIDVQRVESVGAIQSAYQSIVAGSLPPSRAVIVSLAHD